MSDSRQCSTCGEFFGEHEPKCVAAMAERVQDAEHRVAEAVLKADIYYYDRNQEWVITANEAGHEFIAARDDLRRLKGEANG